MCAGAGGGGGEAKIRVGENLGLLRSIFSGLNTDGSFTTAVSTLFFTPLEKNSIAADLEKFRLIFFLY